MFAFVTNSTIVFMLITFLLFDPYFDSSYIDRWYFFRVLFLRLVFTVVYVRYFVIFFIHPLVKLNTIIDPSLTNIPWSIIYGCWFWISVFGCLLNPSVIRIRIIPPM